VCIAIPPGSRICQALADHRAFDLHPDFIKDADRLVDDGLNLANTKTLNTRRLNAHERIVANARL